MLASIFLFLILSAGPVLAEEAIQGPVLADVIRVIDGDSVTVHAHPWPGIVIETIVRMRGLDTPEIRGRCEAEKARAAHARDRLAELAGSRVLLVEVEPDKYGGRVGARVLTENGTDIASALIAEGLARPYDGGKRQGWCGDEGGGHSAYAP
jgi:micrococcal nuclease